MDRILFIKAMAITTWVPLTTTALATWSCLISKVKNKLHKNKKIFAVVSASILALLLTAGGCMDSDSQKIRENTGTAADNFEVQRKIVGVNTRTDKYLFFVEGKCSINRENGWLVSICKHGDNDYRTHFLSESADTSIAITQEAGIDASVYHTRIIIKPESLLPNLELSTGKQ